VAKRPARAAPNAKRARTYHDGGAQIGKAAASAAAVAVAQRQKARVFARAAAGLEHGP